MKTMTLKSNNFGSPCAICGKLVRVGEKYQIGKHGGLGGRDIAHASCARCLMLLAAEVAS